jgi:SSS family transporter
MEKGMGRFTWIDWSVVAAYLVATTFIGARLAGKQSTIREFFLGGRKLPWWAISGSIIATEVSAATIVGVPTISFAAQGNLTYLQLALGSVLARFIVATYFVRRYYENEIYSPYDFVGAQLGPRVKHATTALFFLGAVLGQGARLYITASVLGVVAGVPLTSAIWLMGAFSIGWTLLGGMTTVIWTDVIQFVIMILGATVALIASTAAVPGGAAEVVRLASDVGKFKLFELSPDLSIDYTLWAGLLALPFLNLAAFGTDQVMAQRMFCCRTPADARKAILWSNVSLFIPVLMLFVGVALYAYYTHFPMQGQVAARYASDKNSLFPLFVVQTLPIGVRGVIVAAIFAAGISTLEGALAALSQATMSFILKPADLQAGGESSARTSRAVVISKVWVVVWGVLLCLMAMGCIHLAKNYKNVIDLALALVRYTYGPLLGIFLLAFLKRPRDDAGLPFAVATTILAVYGMSTHGTVIGSITADNVVWAGTGALLVIGLATRGGNVTRSLSIVGACGVVLLLHKLKLRAGDPGVLVSAFWHYPIATLMTAWLGYALANPRQQADPSRTA